MFVSVVTREAGPVRLGIDFGTSTTVAVVAVPGREPRPLLFDGSPLLPSAVCVDPTGRCAEDHLTMPSPQGNYSNEFIRVSGPPT